MRDLNNKLIQQMKDNSDTFWGLQKVHGRYFIEELYKHEQIILGTFAIMNAWELRELVRYPNFYFGSLIKAELAKRKAKAKLLRAHGRLCRKGGQVCLI